MKAHIERDWPSAGYQLYMWYDTGSKKVPMFIEDGRFVYDDKNAAEFGQVLTPTLFIPDEIYEPLRQAMVGEAIDNDDALKDTRAIRDRLLAMVESEWQSRQLEKH